MKLTETIEILTQLSEPGIAVYDPDDIDAIKLGIEALKRCQELRSPTNYSPMRPLPGETEE